MTDKQLSIKLDASLFARAWFCVSTEETRRYLRGVNVEPAPDGGVLLIATDGVKLVALRDPEGTATGDLGDKSGWIVSADAGARKAMKDRRAVYVTVTGDKLAVTDLEGAPIYLQAEPCLIVDGSFPDWRRAVPAHTDKRAEGTFDGRYVAELAKALSKNKRNAPEPLAMFSAGPCDPAICYGADATLDGFGVIMPLRYRERYVLPTWVRKPPLAVKDANAA